MHQSIVEITFEASFTMFILLKDLGDFSLLESTVNWIPVVNCQWGNGFINPSWIDAVFNKNPTHVLLLFGRDFNPDYNFRLKDFNYNAFTTWNLEWSELLRIHQVVGGFPGCFTHLQKTIATDGCWPWLILFSLEKISVLDQHGRNKLYRKAGRKQHQGDIIGMYWYVGLKSCHFLPWRKQNMETYLTKKLTGVLEWNKYISQRY